MGTINPATVSDGDTIDASDLNNPINTIANEINGNLDADNILAGSLTTATLADDAVTDAKQAPKKRCLLTKSAAQNNITDVTATEITFDVEESDSEGWHNPSTNTERITVDEAGLYYICGTGSISGLSAGTRMNIRLYKNGTGGTLLGQVTDEQVAGQTVVTQVSVVTELAASDYVTVAMLHAEGNNTPDFSVGNCRFEVVKLSD